MALLFSWSNRISTGLLSSAWPDCFLGQTVFRQDYYSWFGLIVFSVKPYFDRTIIVGFALLFSRSNRISTGLLQLAWPDCFLGQTVFRQDYYSWFGLIVFSVKPYFDRTIIVGLALLFSWSNRISTGLLWSAWPYCFLGQTVFREDYHSWLGLIVFQVKPSFDRTIIVGFALLFSRSNRLSTGLLQSAWPNCFLGHTVFRQDYYSWLGLIVFSVKPYFDRTIIVGLAILFSRSNRISTGLLSSAWPYCFLGQTVFRQDYYSWHGLIVFSVKPYFDRTIIVGFALLFSRSNRISTGLLQSAWPYCFLGHTVFRQDYYSWLGLIVFSVKPYFDRTIIVGLALLFSRSNRISTGLLSSAWPYCFLGQTVFRQDYYSQLGLIVFLVTPYFDRTIIVGLALLFSRSNRISTGLLQLTWPYCFLGQNRISTGLLQLAWPYCFLGQTVFRQDYYSWFGLIVFSVKPYFDRTIIVGLALLFSRSNRISTGLLQLAWPDCFLGQTVFRQDYYSWFGLIVFSVKPQFRQDYYRRLGLIVFLVKPYFDRTIIVGLALLFSRSNRISTGLLQLALPYCFLGQTVFRQDYYSQLGLYCFLGHTVFRQDYYSWFGLIVFSVKPYFDRTIIVGLALLFSRLNRISTGLLQLAWPYCFLGHTVFRQDYYSWLGLIVFSVKPYFDRTIIVGLALLFSRSNRISTGLLQLAWPDCFLGQTVFREDYYSWFGLIVFSVKPYFYRTIIVGLALLFSRSNRISTGLLQLAWPYCFLGQTVFRQEYYSWLGLIVFSVKPYFDRTIIVGLALLFSRSNRISTGLLSSAWPYCFLGQTVFRQDYYSQLGFIVFLVTPYFGRTIIVGLALLFSRSNRISTGLLQLAWPYCFLGSNRISTGLLQLVWPYCFLGQTVFRQDYYSWLGLIVFSVKLYFDRTIIVGLALLFSRSNRISTGLLQLAWPDCFLGQTVFRQDYYSWFGLIVFSVKPYFDRTIIVGLALLFSWSNRISTGLLQSAWLYCFLGHTVFRQDYYSWLGLIVFSVKPYFDRTIIVGLALLFSRSNRISTGLLQLVWPYCFLGQTVFRQDYYRRLGLIVFLVKPYFDRTIMVSLALLFSWSNRISTGLLQLAWPYCFLGQTFFRQDYYSCLCLIVFSVKPYFDRTIIVSLA